MDRQRWEDQLNAPSCAQRLDALRQLMVMVDAGEISPPERLGFTNNHVHTQYSFSPYSPSKAVWMGYMSGLDTIGIMDHDTLRGAREFIEAGQIAGIATTIGFEMRTDWHNTPIQNCRINNPDQDTSAYIAAHGIPHNMIDQVDDYLRPIREARNIRNRKEVERINALIADAGIQLDFDADVFPLSMAHDGGSITERHILFALTQRMLDAVGRGAGLIQLLEKGLGLDITNKQHTVLMDMDYPYYAYDVLNVLKSSFVSRIYLNTQLSETPHVQDAVDFIRSIGAIASYCYLGDVGASPTGDKKAQKFEDDYLEDVLDACQTIGFHAIAYMPSRNTPAQLQRVMAMCDERDMLQISGEDINQPRQSFICQQLMDPMYSHLILSTWAMIGHELHMTHQGSSPLLNGSRSLRRRMQIAAQYAVKSLGAQARLDFSDETPM